MNRSIFHLPSSILVLCLLAGCSSGCGGRAGYTGTRTSLQPGDKLEFSGTDAAYRAERYADVSLNTHTNGSPVVIIARPTTLLNE